MKSLVVLSGGMDSATALALEVDRYGADEVAAVTFNYGSKHNARENDAARLLAKHYGVEFNLIALPFIGDLFKSDLLKSGGAVPEGHYAEESMKRTVVPYRNAIMLSIAAGLAASRGAANLIIGNHEGDHAIYPDCREEFMAPFAQAIAKGDWNGVTIERPFERLTKAGIVGVGAKLGLPYGLTWTCYKGGDRHCGKCGTCTERLEAFELAGVVDPVEYDDRTAFTEVLASNR